MTLVSREELKTLQDQGKSLPSEAYSKTSSPVSMDMETTTPIRTYGSSIEFPVVITVKNVGGGTVCLDESVNCKKEGGLTINPDLYKLRLNIILPIGLRVAENSCKLTEDIVLVKRLDKDLPPVFIDPQQMEQVFVNLIANACHLKFKSA